MQSATENLSSKLCVILLLFRDNELIYIYILRKYATDYDILNEILDLFSKSPRPGESEMTSW